MPNQGFGTLLAMNEDDVMDAWDVRTLFVVVGLVIGLLYGLVAQATRFLCSTWCNRSCRGARW
jgi:hypothetical protein